MKILHQVEGCCLLVGQMHYRGCSLSEKTSKKLLLIINQEDVKHYNPDAEHCVCVTEYKTVFVCFNRAEMLIHSEQQLPCRQLCLQAFIQVRFSFCVVKSPQTENQHPSEKRKKSSTKRTESRLFPPDHSEARSRSGASGYLADSESERENAALLLMNLICDKKEES